MQNEARFYIEELLLEQFDVFLEKDAFIKVFNECLSYFRLGDSTNLNSIFDKMKQKIKDSETLDLISTNFFLNLNKHLKFDEFLKLSYVQHLFPSEEFERSFIFILKENHLTKFKQQTLNIFLNFIKEFIANLDQVHSQNLKTNLIVNIFSIADIFSNELDSSIKHLIIHNPNKDSFIFMLLDYSLRVQYKPLNRLLFLAKIKNKVCSVFEDIEKKNILMDDVEALKSIIESDHKMEIVRLYARMCFSEINLPNVQISIVNCVQFVDDNIEKINLAKDLVDFLKSFQFNMIEYESPLLEIVNKKYTAPVKFLQLPVNNKELISMAEFYSKAKESNVFQNAFTNNYKRFEKIDAESLFEMKQFFITFYQDFARDIFNIKEIENKFFNMKFSQMKSKKEISSEVNLLKEFIIIDTNLEAFMVDSLLNMSRLPRLKSFVQKLYNCFSIFELKSGELNQLLDAFNGIAKEDTFKICDLNEVLKRKNLN